MNSTSRQGDNSSKGQRNRGTMNLIDNGASHNFISIRLVQMLGLHVEPTKSYGVRLWDANRKRT